MALIYGLRIWANLRTRIVNIFRLYGEIISSAFISVITLLLLNILLPKLMLPEIFGEWRKVVLAMALAGIVHLGIGDALLKIWSKDTKLYPSRKQLIQYAAVIMVVSVIYTLIAYISGFIEHLYLLFYIYCVTFGLFTILFSKLICTKEIKNFIILYNMQSIWVALGLMFLVFSHNLSSTGLLSVYILSNILSLSILLKIMREEVSTESPILYPSSLIFTLGGVNILVSNITFLLLLQVDKLFASQSLSKAEFASYSLMSTLLLAASTIFGQIGNMLFARGLLDRSRIKVGICLVLTIIFGLISAGWWLEHNRLEAYFANYDLSAVFQFIAASFIMSLISIYYFPIMKYSQSSRSNYLNLTTVVVFLILTYFYGRFYAISASEIVNSYLSSLILYLALAELTIRSSGKGDTI